MIVVEEAMRFHYVHAMRLQSAGPGKYDVLEVSAALLKAASLAEKALPYRHHRLATIKLDKDPVMGELHEHATVAELEAEMQKHLQVLLPILELEAVKPAAEEPSDGVANREGFEEGPKE